ncbi:ABC transporter substrate-binding protein [Paenibacillus rhizoplanae]
MRTRLLGLMAAVLLATGCSSGAGNGAPEGTAGDEEAGTKTAAEQEPVKLKFSIWGNDAQKAMVEGLVDEFEQLHSGIEVEIMTIPFADYQQKLSIMLASRTAPDAGWLAERMIPQLLESGQLVDIAAEVEDDAEYNYADIYPSTLDIFRREDRLYGIPFSTPPVLIYYNKDLFLAKGLKTPTELYEEGNWNYKEFLKAARSITDPQRGIYGVKLVRDWNNWSDALLPLFWSHGAELFDSGGALFALNSPAGKEALQLYSDMMFKNKVHPLPGDELTFDSGRIGMYTDRYSYTSKARAVTDFAWDIAPMPAGIKGDRDLPRLCGSVRIRDGASGGSGGTPQVHHQRRVHEDLRAVFCPVTQVCAGIRCLPAGSLRAFTGEHSAGGSRPDRHCPHRTGA